MKNKPETKKPKRKVKHAALPPEGAAESLLRIPLGQGFRIMGCGFTGLWFGFVVISGFMRLWVDVFWKKEKQTGKTLPEF